MEFGIFDITCLSFFNEIEWLSEILLDVNVIKIFICNI